MGKMSRTKGAVYERELVKAAKERGLYAQRVPLSGATDYAKGDVEITANYDGNTVYRIEAKRRARLPKWQVEALGDNDVLAMRADHGQTHVFMRLDTFLDLLQ